MTTLHATEVGRQVAFSGLRPQTLTYILEYLALKGTELRNLMPDWSGDGGDRDKLDFALSFSVLSSPEFSGTNATRFIPYGLEFTVPNAKADGYSNVLSEIPWMSHRGAANAAALLSDWISGAPIGDLERRFAGLRAGGVRGLAAEVAWVLTGVANVLAAATNPSLSVVERPTSIRSLSAEKTAELRALLPAIRLLMWRLNVGLPISVLWTSEFRSSDGRQGVSRSESLAIEKGGMSSFEHLRQRQHWPALIASLKASGVPRPNDRAVAIQKMANGWHKIVRERSLEHQSKRLNAAGKALLIRFYESRETKFEKCFEEMLEMAKISYTKFDDGKKSGAFDYFIHCDKRDDVIVELKSKQGEGLVDLESARTVLASSDQYGFSAIFCVSVCHPGVDPNVPPLLSACPRLAIAESHDFAEGLVRVAQGIISKDALFNWMTQPGQLKSSELYSHSSVLT